MDLLGFLVQITVVINQDPPIFIPHSAGKSRLLSRCSACPGFLPSPSGKQTAPDLTRASVTRYSGKLVCSWKKSRFLYQSKSLFRPLISLKYQGLPLIPAGLHGFKANEDQILSHQLHSSQTKNTQISPSHLLACLLAYSICAHPLHQGRLRAAHKSQLAE